MNKAKSPKKDITTGFMELDKYLNGLKPGQLIIVGSSPGMGKTSLALNMVYMGCKQSNLPVIFFSLEMEAQEVSTRLLASNARVDLGRIRTKDFNLIDTENITRVNLELKKMPFFISDNSKINLTEIKNLCRNKKTEGELGFIVIDYLQLLGRNENPEIPYVERISKLLRELKVMAKELQCPVIVLSQLDIQYEVVTNKKIKITGRPSLANLLETADADIILLLYRQDLKSKEASPAEVIIAKNRVGVTDTVKINWIGNHTRFEDQ